jgi:hypothetical protein
MKKCFISGWMLLCFSLTAISQQTTVTAPKYKIDTVSKKIIYTEVVNQPGISDTLYNRAIHWCGIYFKNLHNISVMDKLDGKISGHYSYKIFDKPDKDSIKVLVCTVNFNFSIDLQNNKYRYKITDFTRSATPAFPIEHWLDKKDPGYKPQWDYYFAQLDKHIQDMIISLKQGMMEAVKVEDKW